MIRRFISVILILFVLLFENSLFSQEDEYVKLRKWMVQSQIVVRGVKDEAVISALLKVPRHEFVPFYLRAVAYQDRPLPIGHGQTISQPYIVALMTALARVKKDDKVLEIGTGSGYQAAILAELAKEVYTIEILKPLADKASERLKKLGYKNIHVKCGDGYKGWPEAAPFDTIIVTAAPDRMPDELVKELKIGGRIIVPVGTFYQELKVGIRDEKGLSMRNVIPVRFVPMVHGKE